MRSIFAFVAAASLSAAVPAQQSVSDQDHAAHHPDGASAPAAAATKPPPKPNAPAAMQSPASGAAPAGMGMSGDMQKMHDEAHKPGGMHDQMHGKKMGGQMPVMPAASAASK